MATTMKTPTSIEEWEALWATGRAAIVKRIKDNKWGKSADGRTLTGPESFTIDLSKCPAGWSDTEGLTDTSVKIGQDRRGPGSDGEGPDDHAGRSEPRHFIAMLAATPCTQVVTEAAENGMKESVKYLFQPQTCSGTSFLSKDRVGGDGAASDGWWIVSPGFKDFKDPSQANDPFVEWARELLESKGIDPDQTSKLGDGLGAYGWVMAQTLMIAGELNEGSQLQKFDAAQQLWVSEGAIIDLDGKSKNCRFDQAAGICIAY